MSKISNETKLILELAKERANKKRESLTDSKDVYQRARKQGLTDYESILNEIVAEMEKK